MKDKLYVLVVVLIFLSAFSAKCFADEWANFNSVTDSAQLSSYPHYECFKQASEKYGVPILLLMSIAKGESNFNPRAEGEVVTFRNGKYKGLPQQAFGVMQILWPSTGRDHLNIKRKKDLYDPCINIDAGARYLSEMLSDKYYNGDIYHTIGAYNGGPNWEKSKSKNKIANVKDYIAYIRRSYEYIVSRIDTKKFVKKYIPKIFCSFRNRFLRFTDAEIYEEYILAKYKNLKYDNPALVAKYHDIFKNYPDTPFEIIKTPLGKFDLVIAANSLEDNKKLIEIIEQITGLRDLECIQRKR